MDILILLVVTGTLILRHLKPPPNQEFLDFVLAAMLTAVILPQLTHAMFNGNKDVTKHCHAGQSYLEYKTGLVPHILDGEFVRCD